MMNDWVCDVLMVFLDILGVVVREEFVLVIIFDVGVGIVVVVVDLVLSRKF